jgi:hypothetical protein
VIETTVETMVDTVQSKATLNLAGMVDVPQRGHVLNLKKLGLVHLDDGSAQRSRQRDGHGLGQSYDPRRLSGAIVVN